MQRRHDIDALRVFAFALLIVYHVAMVYVAEWGFHIKSGYQADWLQAPMIAINRWRMPLLFMISGIAIGLAQPRRGVLRFAAARSWRLLVPLLFAMFSTVAVQAYCEGRANGHVAPGFVAFLLRYWQVQPWPPGSFSGWESGITWNHLWYLAYLWPYTMLLLAMVGMHRLWMDHQSRDRKQISLAPPSAKGEHKPRFREVEGHDRLLRDEGKRAMAWPDIALLSLPAVWLALCLLVLLPRFPETHALLGDWYVHAESLPLFLMGYLVARRGSFWNRLQRLRWPTTMLALTAMTAELSIRTMGRILHPGDLPPWLAMLPWYGIERIARAAYTWTALLAIFGWARVALDRPFRWLPYCSEAVFPWYILHQSLIIPLAFWLVPLHLGPVVEPLLVLLGTVGGCLLLHELLIRRIALLRPLFGLKYDIAAQRKTEAPRVPPTSSRSALPCKRGRI